MKTIIEETAIALAAQVYEDYRMAGMDCKPYKNQRQFVRKNFIKYIPQAAHILMQMLGPDSRATPEMKEEIYNALMERNAFQPKVNGQIIDPKFLH